MPNNNLDGNVSQVVLKKFVKGFESNRVLSKTVDRQLIKREIDTNTGDSVSLKRPHQFATIDTPDGNITGKQKNNLVSGTVIAKVDNYITVAVSWTQVEQAMKLNQLEKILNPIAATMATKLETRLANYMIRSGALSLGTPGQAISNWADVARVGSLLTDLGVTGSNYAAINPWAAQNLAGAQIALENNDLVRTAWEKAQIPRNFGGVQAITSNGLVARTQGAFGGALTVKTAPVVTYESVKDTYQFTTTLTGATASKTGFLKAGDQLIFDGVALVNQQTKEPLFGSDGGEIDFTATVLTDADSDASGDVTVTLSGVPIFDSTNPQYNTVSRAVADGDSVEVRGVSGKTIKPSLFYNEEFVGMGSIVLPKLHSIDSSVISYDGLSIRVHKYADGDANTQMMRFDMLPTFACFNQFKGGQLFGQA
jgi:hypothetical protein